MSIPQIRPDVSDLMMHVFRRSVHPELFEIHDVETIRQDDYEAVVRICETGHWVTFSARGDCICELVTARQQLLPQRQRFLERKLRGSRDEFVQFDHGVAYHVCYQLEHLDPEVFLTLHEELLLDSRRATVAHCFSGNNRIAPCALSFLVTDVGPHSLIINAFHTFPENCAVVKTQSLFELRSLGPASPE